MYIYTITLDISSNLDVQLSDLIILNIYINFIIVV